jgi:transglutaminase-like putative cysteine protease
MRIRISHETRYHYAAPISGVIQTLRLTPRNHDGHYVVRWRIDVTEDCRLNEHEDAFGNITHTFTADGPFTDLGVQVEGEIEVQDTAGIVQGTIERFPPSLYLRATALTEPDAAIAHFARETRAQADDTLPLLHALLGRIHSEMTFDTVETGTTTTAAEAFTLKRGVCQDLTHIFIAAARHLDIPARYVGGYFHRVDGVTQQDAGHAWAEAYVPSVGWIAFDPTNGICATEAYVRVAVGLDYLGASPVRGARRGGGTESMAVKVVVDQAARQVQS